MGPGRAFAGSLRRARCAGAGAPRDAPAHQARAPAGPPPAGVGAGGAHPGRPIPPSAESADARAAYAAELDRLAERASLEADEARARGLDPFTLRELAGDSGAGAKLLDVLPVPSRFSYSAFSTYETCPMQYAFRYVYRIPQPSAPSGALTFGGTAHAAFEAFTKERRERAAAGEPPPTREDLERLFWQEWRPLAFGDKPAEDAYRRRATGLLDNFWSGEVASLGKAELEEQYFELVIEDAGRRAAGGGDRLHRPHRPAAVRRDRGDRLQDRQGQQPEGR